MKAPGKAIFCINTYVCAAFRLYLRDPRLPFVLVHFPAMLLVLLSAPQTAALVAPTPSTAGRRLRLAQAEDLAQVAQLQLETFDPEAPPSKPLFGGMFGGGGGGGRAGRAERLAAELAERVAKGSDLWVVEAEAVLELGLLGTADLSEQEVELPTHGVSEGPSGEYPTLYLSSMAVDPSTRRRGIGREMLLAAEQRATERGARGIWLHVERANEPAIALYEGSGFKRMPTTPQYATFTTALQLAQKEPLLMFKKLETT